MIDRSDHVRVLSTHEEIRSRWDGKDYVFKVGTPVDIHHVIAAHIFGFGNEDKAAAFARLGWAQSSDQHAAALKRLANVKFSVPPALIEAPEPEVERASASTLVPRRTQGGAPIASGADEAAGDHPVSPAASSSQQHGGGRNQAR